MYCVFLVGWAERIFFPVLFCPADRNLEKAVRAIRSSGGNPIQVEVARDGAESSVVRTVKVSHAYRAILYCYLCRLNLYFVFWPWQIH